MLVAPVSFLVPAFATPVQEVPSERARALAARAETWAEPALVSLAELVAFDTFARPDVPNAEHPSFRAMSAWLERTAHAFGLDFADHGAVVVIGLGKGADRLGIVTHGDVQPAEAEKWARGPFTLDVESEPGRLVGRGVEDDKGPIVATLYAMRTLAEAQVPLRRRIELIVSYTEESDWEPFQTFLAQHPPPALNVAVDAEYPVVVGEKGWCSVNVRIPLGAPASGPGPRLESFTGGFFLSQVPEDARATVRAPTPELVEALRAAAARDPDVRFELEPGDGVLSIRAHGLSAHSSKPEEGRNAITHLAALLGAQEWPASGPGAMVRFVNDLVGTGWKAERFGDLAYADDFMGPLTLSLGTLAVEGDALVAGINLRRPVGRTAEQVRAAIDSAVAGWRTRTGVAAEVQTYVGDPHLASAAEHVPVLLATFRHYTGQSEAAPISIGGGTHARLVPQGVNFGPAMPGETYTGHSEHEYLTRAQFLLNLRMVTSILVDLAGA